MHRHCAASTNKLVKCLKEKIFGRCFVLKVENYFEISVFCKPGPLLLFLKLSTIKTKKSKGRSYQLVAAQLHLFEPVWYKEVSVTFVTSVLFITSWKADLSLLKIIHSGFH